MCMCVRACVCACVCVCACESASVVTFVTLASTGIRLPYTFVLLVSAEYGCFRCDSNITRTNNSEVPAPVKATATTESIQPGIPTDNSIVER